MLAVDRIAQFLDKNVVAVLVFNVFVLGLVLLVFAGDDGDRVGIKAGTVPTGGDLAFLERVILQNHVDVFLGRFDLESLEVSTCVLLLNQLEEIRGVGNVNFLRKNSSIQSNQCNAQKRKNLVGGLQTDVEDLFLEFVRKLEFFLFDSR